MLLLLELGLRLFGWMLAIQRSQQNARTAEGGLRILAIGESTTYLGGADAYPTQLERILGEVLGPSKVVVYNGGIPGADTNRILENLDEQLRQYRPHVVIAMMGASDNGTRVVFTSSPRGIRPQWLAGLRSYRLLRTAFEQVTQAKPQPAPPEYSDAPDRRRMDPDPIDERPQSRVYQQVKEYDGRGGFGNNLSHLEQAIRADPADPRPYLELAEVYLTVLNQVSKAETLCRQACQLAPEESWTHTALARVHFLQGHLDETHRELEAARRGKLAHLCKVPQLVRWYLFLLEQEQDRENTERLLASMERNSPPSFYRGVAYVYYLTHGQGTRAEEIGAVYERQQTRTYNPDTHSNFLKLYDKSLQYGFELVCSQYGGRSADPLRLLFAHRPRVTIVDNREPFHSYIAAGRYYEVFGDNCHGDIGHATALGNRFLAQNCARALLALGFGREAGAKALNSAPQGDRQSASPLPSGSMRTLTPLQPSLLRRGRDARDQPLPAGPESRAGSKPSIRP